jgi:hypothetical protein
MSKQKTSFLENISSMALAWIPSVQCNISRVLPGLGG